MKYLTFLNSGCLEICLNMLKSAENVGIDMNNFHIACLDESVYNKLIDLGYSGSYLYIDQELKEYQNWTFDKNSGFRNIVKYKWKIIQEIYKKFPELTWVDTDIVFLKNPIQFTQNQDKVLFQSDLPGSTLCTGFVVFNDTEYCRNLIQECSNFEGQDDQLIMNEIALKKYINYISILDENLFPNGNVYYIQKRKSNAIIVHNNWMIGVNTKIQKFKEENLWFL